MYYKIILCSLKQLTFVEFEIKNIEEIEPPQFVFLLNLAVFGQCIRERFVYNYVIKTDCELIKIFFF